MKKIKMVICMLLLMPFNALTETLDSGFVEKVDLQRERIVIDNVSYKIKKNQTSLLSGEHKLNLNSLKVGDRVSFSSSDRDVTEIRMTTPHKFRH